MSSQASAPPVARPRSPGQAWSRPTFLDRITAASARRARRGRVLRGEGLLLAAILAVAAALNCIGLAAEGYANSYYAATVKSMLTSWHNFFFVSYDPGGFVTVDKPPLGFWIQAAFAKVLGFHGWSILLPQALAGVASVALLYYLVRRTWGPLAGCVAALALALTPISVVTNRNNTIDSLLVLTLLGAAWAVTKAIESPRHRCAGCCSAAFWSVLASTSRCSKPTWRSPRSG
ncbi:MAG: glycosyltransferase family 39 protein [Chloroflexia bacterium]